MMKRLLIIYVFSTLFGFVYAQTKGTNKIKNQTEKLDSLKIEILKINLKIDNLAKDIGLLNKELKPSRSNNEETSLVQTRDSLRSLQKEINQLRAKLSKKEEAIQKNKNKEYQKGKDEVLQQIIMPLKGKSFDELIKSSTIALLQNLHQYIEKSLNTENNFQNEIKDLCMYFELSQIFQQKVNENQLKKAKTRLTQISQSSALMEQLRQKMEGYNNYKSGLKETIEKIIEIDRNEKVQGMHEDVQMTKYNKISILVSKFLFSYAFKFKDYPHLASIINEILLQKFPPNTDSDISYLLNEL